MLTEDFLKDINDVQSIDALPTILDVLSQSTGMGFVAVARVTTEKWITCGVLDNLAFGLVPGDELKVESTICHEVRQAEKLVVIDHVDDDPEYRAHPTPAQYGFQSYISVPIVRKDGGLFGTLCAIDPKPNKLNNPRVIGMFSLYAELISFHLEALETLRKKNREIINKNVQLDSYSFISSHDIQEPLRKIQMFSSVIREKEGTKLSESAREYFDGIDREASRLRKILKDLLDYSEAEPFAEDFEPVDLASIVENVKMRLANELKECKGRVSIGDMYTVQGIPVQMEQLFYILVTNSVSFRSQDRELHIDIVGKVRKGKKLGQAELDGDTSYCEVTVTDNGRGFDQVYSEKIFEMFRRLDSDIRRKSTGMGLAIARRIAENHNGTITASGILGLGASFTIYLPVAH
ncbi:MAG: ATP-binding protein [Sediminicola sp.]